MKLLMLLTAGLLLPLLVFAPGCVKRAPLTPVQTTSLNTNQAIASIATTNKAMAKDVIALNQSSLIGKDLTNSVLNWNRAVAQAVQTAVLVQKSALSDVEKMQAVKAAFSVLKLPPDVAALLAGPQTDQALAGLFSTINALQQLIAASTGGTN